VSAVRVAFVSSHAKLGGAERYLELLLAGLGPEWVAGVVSLEDGPFVQRLRELGHRVEVVHTGARPLDLARSVRPLRRALSSLGGAVVHANGIKAALLAGAAVTGTGRPLVWVKHDFTGDGALARVAAARADQVVAVSSAVAETFPARTRGRKVHVVPNALPETELSGDERERLRELAGAPDSARVIAVVGRIAPDKGQHELLAAAPAIRRRVPTARFVFLGGETDSESAYAESLRASAAADGLEEAMSFLGFREDAAALIAGCDAVVVPSVRDRKGRGREGFGLVGLEAFAVGTPVVGYADGALRETLGECALLVPPGDREALADAVVSVLEDPGEAARLAECGRARVSGRFSPERLVARMQERYRAAAKAGRRR
jgi:glycosyltransferase involved in cell wall biosynthesis